MDATISGSVVFNALPDSRRSSVEHYVPKTGYGTVSFEAGSAVLGSVVATRFVFDTSIIAGAMIGAILSSQTAHAVARDQHASTDTLDANSLEAARHVIRDGLREGLAPLAVVTETLQDLSRKIRETVERLQRNRGIPK